MLAAWNELGLLRALADGPKALEALAGERRALEITVPVLQHLGLVHREGDRVRLSSSGQRLLEAGELPTARNFEFLRDQARIAEVLEKGGPVAAEEGGDKATEGGVRRHDPEGSARFLDMLFYTRAGRSHATTRARAWLREAGLSEPELVVREGFQLLRSRRVPGEA